jgi:bifunctional DNA-binding transcriptional regulator/antitoxin component of YhaV-PrlF toxin-antitoxin module
MKLIINPSKLMEDKVSEEKLTERKVIRIPRELREAAGINLGGFLNMRTTDNDIISLFIGKAYEEDVVSNTSSAYVTNEIFELLTNSSSNSCEVKLIDNVTLGCDPELILVDRKDASIITAGKYFKKWDPVGCDGLLLEFRPLPSTDENVVVTNIFNMLKQARLKINDPQVMITAVSSYKKITAGFHLHYGLPKELLGPKNSETAEQIVKVLDYYVGVPSILPEGKEDIYRRTTPYLAYGKPGNYRLDNRTLEYRVPGAALMKHPVLTKGIISIGATVVEDVVNRIKHCTDNFTKLGYVSTDKDIRELYPDIPPAMTMFSIICSADTELAMIYYENIRSGIEKMVGYEKRADSINKYFKCVESGIQFSPDMETNWYKHSKYIGVGV